MKLSEDTNQSNYIIKGYQHPNITINDTTYRHSLIVSGDTLIEPWTAKSITTLTLKDLQPLLDLSPELILLGCGTTHQFLPPQLSAELMQQHIGLEVMLTSAACRTFNLLANDGRQVVAGLLID